MPVLTQNFEGVTPSGTTTSTVNSAVGTGNTGFNFCQTASITNASDSTHAAHGTLGLKIATTGTAAAAYNQWKAAYGTQAQTWFRLYLYFTANPAAANHKLLGMAPTAGGSCGSLYVNSTGHLLMTDSAAATQITSTSTIPLNAWFRVEGFLTPSTTVGQVSFSMWTTSGMDSAGTADEIKTSAATLNTNANVGILDFGNDTAVANVGPYWADDIGVSSTGYLGPAVTATSVTAVLPSGTGAAWPPSASTTGSAAAVLASAAGAAQGATASVPATGVIIPPTIAFSPAGGTPGNTVAAGAGAAGSFGTPAGAMFDSVSVPAGSTLVYGNATGLGPSIDLATTSAVTPYGLFGNFLGTRTTAWFRADLYLAANPSAQVEVITGLSSGSRAADITITTAGKITARNAAGATLFTTTASIPLSTPFRVEGFITGSAAAGQVEIKLYPSRSATTATETQTSAATQNTLGQVSQIRFGLGLVGATGISYSMGTCAVSPTGYVGPAAVVQQMACGAPTASGFTVISKPVGGTSLRLAYSTSPSMTSPSYVAAQTPDSYGYVKHVVSGLSAYTRYWCQLADTVDGAEVLTGTVGTCKTLPAAGAPASFTVALASCTNTANETPSPNIAIDDWVAWQADLNIHTGDYDYENPAGTTTAAQAGMYEYHTAFYGSSAQIATAWGFYCRSDHDSSNTDNGESNNTWTVANIAAAQEIFPFGTLGDTVNTPVHGLYQAWVAGRVRFIMLDIRNTDRSTSTNTDNSSKTMLGATQLAWFQAQLVQPEPLKVIICDTAWMSATISGELDKWWSYGTERSAILSYIAANAGQVQNLMLWHGDSHMLGYATAAANASWGGFPVWCAAPLRQTGAANSGAAAFTATYNNAGGECRQYGRITFTDTGTLISVTFVGWDALNGTAQLTRTETFATPNAGLASGTGTAGGATPAVAVTAAAASGAGTAQNATAAITFTAAAAAATGTGTARSPAVTATASPPAALASGAGTALGATVTAAAAPVAAAATGTGAARGPALAIAVTAVAATGAGTALGATASTVTSGTANAAVAAGTGTAQSPAVAVAVNVTLAAGTGAALGASASTAAAGTATAVLAAGTGTAQAATAAITVTATATAASGTGTALNPAAGSAATPAATAAAGTGTAQSPAPAVAVTAGVASGSGTGQGATVTAAASPAAVLATGTGAALNAAASTAAAGTAGAVLASGTGTAAATPAVGVNAGLATGAGTALNATVSTAAFTSAQAVLATGTGTARNPGLTLTGSATAAAATGTGTTGSAPAAGVNAAPASGAGTALNAIGQTGWVAPAGLAHATGAAQTPAAVLVSLAQTAAATALGAALRATAKTVDPFTVGRLTTATAPLATLTAGATGGTATLTATDTRTGGPGG